MNPFDIEVHYANYMRSMDATHMFPLDNPFADLDPVDLDVEPNSPEFETTIAKIKHNIASLSGCDSFAVRDYISIKEWQLAVLEAKRVNPV